MQSFQSEAKALGALLLKDVQTNIGPPVNNYIIIIHLQPNAIKSNTFSKRLCKTIHSTKPLIIYTKSPTIPSLNANHHSTPSKVGFTTPKRTTSYAKRTDHEVKCKKLQSIKKGKARNKKKQEGKQTRAASLSLTRPFNPSTAIKHVNIWQYRWVNVPYVQAEIAIFILQRKK